MTMSVYFNKRLQYLASVKKYIQADLARVLGQNTSTISKWWNGEIVPGVKNRRIIAEHFDCDYEWLTSGKGTPFEKRAKHKIERYSGNVDEDGLSLGGEGSELTTHGEAWDDENYSANNFEETTVSNMRSMVSMAMDILASKSPYRSTFVSTIKAFHNALVLEGEMNRVREELSAMREDNRLMAAEVAELKELLLSLGAVADPKKGSATSS